MNPESRYLRELRMRAGRHLAPDFPARVLHDARVRQRRSQRNKLTVITAALCVLLAVSAHWVMTAATDRHNQAMWAKEVQQIAVLEQTI